MAGRPGYDLPAVLGVAGSADAVAASLSPLMHRAAFDAAGMTSAYYIPLSLRESSAAKALRSLPRLGFHGVNVTTPFKGVAAEVAHSHSERVSKSGSANTLTIDRSGRIRADSTDGQAVVEAIAAQGTQLAGATVALLGAGGVARDIAVALEEAGVVALHIWNRTSENAEALRDLPLSVEVRTHSEVSSLPETTVLIGTIPTTAYEHIDLRGRHAPLVVDLAYDRHVHMTPLQAIGAASIGGREILARQGALSFSIWHGDDPPYDVMRSALD